MEEQKKENNDVFWAILKIGARGLARFGAGLVTGLGLKGIPLNALTGPVTKAAAGFGILCLADAAGEVAGDQAAKRIDDVKTAADFGNKVVNKMEELKKERENS